MKLVQQEDEVRGRCGASCGAGCYCLVVNYEEYRKMPAAIEPASDLYDKELQYYYYYLTRSLAG